MRPGGWNPRIEVRGSSYLVDALRGGRGAILWVGGFVYSDLVTKMALGRSGVGVHHLTRPGHGFSTSRFGIGVLNGLWTRIEDRYLAERITYGNENQVAALRTLSRRLSENKVISITVGDNSETPALTPFLGGSIRLATGAARMALTAGAPLLPVFTVRRDDGVFDVTIRAPLAADSAQDRDTQVKSILSSYATVLEPYVKEFPDQWWGWGLVETSQGPSAQKGS